MTIRLFTLYSATDRVFSRSAGPSAHVEDGFLPLFEKSVHLSIFQGPLLKKIASFAFPPPALVSEGVCAEPTPGALCPGTPAARACVHRMAVLSWVCVPWKPHYANSLLIL